jgi:pantoate--beta-alanine ligase
MCQVDYVFMPKTEDMYPAGFQTYAEVMDMTKSLCGASRPGHFKGVTTIVAKLFNLTQPDCAYFGLKDYQQFAVLKQMVRDLNIPVKMVGVPTVREKDGLAKSSRNAYLTEVERSEALCLSQAINLIKELARNGSKDLTKWKSLVDKFIKKHKSARIDYTSFVDSQTLRPLDVYQKKKTLFALAVFIGKTRLIDNVIV